MSILVFSIKNEQNVLGKEQFSIVCGIIKKQIYKIKQNETFLSKKQNRRKNTTIVDKHTLSYI